MTSPLQPGTRVRDTRTDDLATVLRAPTGPSGADGQGIVVEYDDEPGVPVSTGTVYFETV